MTTYQVPTIVPEKRYEVWHQHDQGDLRHSFFDIQLNERQMRTPMGEWSNVMAEDFATRLKVAFAAGVKVWAGMLGAEGEIPTTKPYLFPHACFIPEPGNEDKRRFYMACRVKRETPQLMPLDSFVQFAELGAVDENEMSRNFLNQMAQFSEHNQHTSAEIVGQGARDNAGLAKRIEIERKAQEMVDYRLNHRPF